MVMVTNVLFVLKECWHFQIIQMLDVIEITYVFRHIVQT